MSVFYREDDGRVLSNPGMGWLIHHSIIPGHRDVNEPDHYEKLDCVALLSQWNHLEPEEGRYCWDALDASIEKWTGLGKRLNFRISTEPMIYNGSGEGVPPYLFDKYGVPYQEKQGYGVAMRYPDYLHPAYQERLGLFLEALRDRYAGLEALETVDLMGYGEWGEWHSGYEYGDYARRVLALRRLLEIWDGVFGGCKPLLLSSSYEWRREMNPPVTAPASYEEFLYWSGFDRALARDTISFRRNGVGGAVKLWDARLMEEAFRRDCNLPMAAEFFIDYNQGISEEGLRGYHLEDALEEALLLHPNYMMMPWDSVKFYELRPDLVDHGLRRMGYRLLPSRTEAPGSIPAGGALPVACTVENRGVGRLWGDYGWELCLLDGAGRTWGRVRETAVPLWWITEERPMRIRSVLPLPAEMPGGVYTLAVSVRDGRDCPVALPMEETRDGWYSLGLIEVTERERV